MTTVTSAIAVRCIWTRGPPVMSKVLIAEEQPVTRHALCLLLKAAGHEVIAEVDNGLDAIEQVRIHAPDVMVLELSIPKLGGLELIKRLSDRGSPVRILVLTSQDSEYYAGRCLQAGAAGFVSKQEPPEAFMMAVKAVSRGQTYFPAHALGTVQTQTAFSTVSTELSQLSARELTVLQLLAQGLSNIAIAEQLLISEKTVSTYKSRLMQKLKATSFVEMVDIARTQGLVVGQAEQAKSTEEDIDPERLRRLEMLHQMIELMPNPIHFRDLEGRLLMCNQALLDMIKATPEEVLGKTILEGDWYPAEQAQYLHESYLKCVEEGKPWRGDFVVDPKSGHRVMHAWLSPYRDPDGRLLGMIGGGVDITGRTQLLVELRNAYEALEAGQRTRSQFLSAIGREISLPLNTAEALLKLVLSEPITNPELQDRLNLVQASITQLTTMLWDLQELSRLESDKRNFSPQSSDLRLLVNEVSGEVHGLAISKGLEFIVELRQVLQPVVWIDPGRFKQLLRNLLSNAIKFTDAGSVVCTLRAIGCGEGLVKVRVLVEDTGIGICEADQARIFEPFVQVHAAGRYRQSGTGLGLALCRQLVVQMKGEILLTSQTGKGTCVRVDFEVPQALNP